MFGGDPFDFDPFGTRRQMRQMEQMMDNMMGGDPFGMNSLFPGFGHARMNMLEDSNSRSGRRRTPHDNQLAAANPFGFGGGIFGNLMQQMQVMENGIANDPHSHVFTQSTMISYDGTGAPKVVQNSVRKSGDVKETRRTVRDGEREEITVGHAIGDREHIIEKKRHRDGRVRKNQKFVNLDEDEAEHFNNEFKTRAHRNINGLFAEGFPSGSRHRALENGRSSRHAERSSDEMEHSGRSRHSASTTKTESKPIVEIPDDDEDDDEIMVTYSNTRNGPKISEITDDDVAGSSSKRRKGMFGKFFGNDD